MSKRSTELSRWLLLAGLLCCSSCQNVPSSFENKTGECFDPPRLSSCFIHDVTNTTGPAKYFPPSERITTRGKRQIRMCLSVVAIAARHYFCKASWKIHSYEFGSSRAVKDLSFRLSSRWQCKRKSWGDAYRVTPTCCFELNFLEREWKKYQKNRLLPIQRVSSAMIQTINVFVKDGITMILMTNNYQVFAKLITCKFLIVAYIIRNFHIINYLHSLCIM